LEKKKIIIIGAGLSGIYLAYLLQDKYDITILEARDRIGGRIFSINSNDLGPSWICSHQKNILSLIQKLGLELFSQYTRGYALYDTKDKVELFTAPPSAPSARLKGSLTKLIDTLKEKLYNTNILLSQEVTDIKEDNYFVHVSSKTKTYKAHYLISTLPHRITANLKFEPQLPNRLISKMLATPTWMANSAKCVIEFKTAFWVEKSLSGFVFSNLGPIGEMHDASHDDTAALFGFINSNADMKDVKQNIKNQLIRLFDINEDEILNIYLLDWKKEKYTASLSDIKPLSTHPSYGIHTSEYSNKIFFSSTEFSFIEGGYLEGAVIQAQNLALQLSSQS